MFSIKCQEIVDKNTGVHLAFGDHGKDKSTVWLRISTRVPGLEQGVLVDKITTVTLHRDGDVINIMPAAEAGVPKPEVMKLMEQKQPPVPPEALAKFQATAQQKGHFVPPVPLTSDDERGKA